MKKSDIIIDAIGELDENTLNTKKPKRNTNVLKLAAVAAACLLIVGAAIPVMRPLLTKAPEAPEVTEVTGDLNENVNDCTATEDVTESQIVSADNLDNKITGKNIIRHSALKTVRTRISGNPESDVLYGREIPVWIDGKLTYKSGYDVEVKICPHEETKEYEIVFDRTEYFTENRAYMLVIPSESIELLTDDLILLDFDDTEPCKANIKFKYKDGYTNGRIEYKIFKEEIGLKLYPEIDAHIRKNGLGCYYENEYDLKGEFAPVYTYGFCFATIKGYDFEQNNWNTRLDWVYTLAAEYFGDVDDKGEPLFKSNPYIAEYYDGPFCYNERNTYEKFLGPNWYENPPKWYTNQFQETRGKSSE